LSDESIAAFSKESLDPEVMKEIRLGQDDMD
jgi:hypothetical protein